MNTTAGKSYSVARRSMLCYMFHVQGDTSRLCRRWSQHRMWPLHSMNPPWSTRRPRKPLKLPHKNTRQVTPMASNSQGLIWGFCSMSTAVSLFGFVTTFVSLYRYCLPLPLLTCHKFLILRMLLNVLKLYTVPLIILLQKGTKLHTGGPPALVQESPARPPTTAQVNSAPLTCSADHRQRTGPSWPPQHAPTIRTLFRASL